MVKEPERLGEIWGRYGDLLICLKRQVVVVKTFPEGTDHRTWLYAGLIERS